MAPAATLLLHRPAGANWQMWHNSGLAALGIALENDSIVDVAINRDKYGYHFLIDKHKMMMAGLTKALLITIIIR